MNAAVQSIDTATPHTDQPRYARCIKASKRVRWDIDADVIRGRRFDFSKKFLPDGLTQPANFPGLSAVELRTLSHVQGRTYACIFGLVERAIGAKILEVSQDHWFGDQIALEALVRFTDEELKHQELFRRIEKLIAEDMPDGYRMVADPNDVARFALGKSTWGMLALTCHIELFTQSHYQQSIDGDPELSELFRDVFMYHWKEEAQHAMLDELEWVRDDRKLTPEQRDRGVDDLIELVAAVDGILQAQSSVDADYFFTLLDRTLSAEEQATVRAGLLKAYRWQYIVSGVQHPHFIRLLSGMTTPTQMNRIVAALQPILAA